MKWTAERIQEDSNLLIYKKYMSPKIKSVLIRFLKAAISGAFASMSIATVVAPSNWTDFTSILNILAISALYGSITGVIMAGQKLYSWKD